MYTTSNTERQQIWEEPDIAPFVRHQKNKTPPFSFPAGGACRDWLCEETPAIICRLQPSTDKQISELSLLKQNHFTSKWYTFYTKGTRNRKLCYYSIQRSISTQTSKKVFPTICVPLNLLGFAVKRRLLPFRTRRQAAVWVWATQSQPMKTQSFLFCSRPN